MPAPLTMAAPEPKLGEDLDAAKRTLKRDNSLLREFDDSGSPDLLAL